MREVMFICDRCGHKKTEKAEYQFRDNGWKEIGITTTGFDHRLMKEYLLCPDCCLKLGIADKKSITDNAPTIADRLVECIVEIVANAQT